MGKERISIYNIAREAEVSPATVSRVLTGNANVSPEKKTKVEALIKKYDFRPNAMARGLSSTQSKLIGFLTPDIRNPFHATLAVACERAANERGYSLMLSNYLNDMDLQTKNLQRMIEMRVDALIMIGGKVDELVSDEDYVERINQVTDTIPVVITGKLDGSDCYQVNIDHGKAMEAVMEHLLQYGHSRIMLIGGKREVHSTYVKRIRYKNSLRKYGIPYREEYVVDSDEYSVEGGLKVMDSIFDRGMLLPTAVVAINDFMAMGIMQSVRRHGLEIPKDISVVSFDDTFIAEAETPRLTSVGYRYDEFGVILLETAIAAIEGKEPPKMQLISPELAVRESTRKVQAGP